MVSYKRLLQDVEAVVLGPSDHPTTFSKQGTFLRALDLYKDAFRNLLDRPQPKPEDHAKVVAKELQLPDGTLTPLDDQDAQIVLKLSADYKLNEVECVKLLVATHQQFSLIGRSPLEILRLTAGLYMTERRSILTALHLILKMVVLEEGAPEEVVAYTRQYVVELLNGGLGARILSVLKDLNREEPAGCGGPQTEPYVIDARGTLVKRSQVAQRERLLLAQCRVYVTFVSRIGPSDAKDLFTLLQDSARDWSVTKEAVRLQIAYTLLFALLCALVSDSMGGGDLPESVLAKDPNFIREFHEAVMAPPVTPSPTDGFLSAIRLAWGIFVGNTSGREQQARAVLTAPNLLQGFRFLHDQILTATPFQNDEPELVYIYRAYLHRTLVCLLTHPIGRHIIKATKDAAVSTGEGEEGLALVSLMEVVGEVYSQEPELMEANSALTTFVLFVGEDNCAHSYKMLTAFLRLLTSLATGQEGARQVYGWLQGGSFRAVSWATLFNTLVVYDGRMRAGLQPGGDVSKAQLPQGDALALEAYLACLKRVVEQGEPNERAGWFGDIEPLFCLLQYSGVPPRFKGALRSAIGAFVDVGPAMRDRIWQLMEHFDLPLGGGGGGEEVYSMTYELNRVEGRQELYPSSLSYLHLLNVLIEGEIAPRDEGRRYIGVFRFVRDQVLGPYAQRGYKEEGQKWQMAALALTYLVAMMKMYRGGKAEGGDEVPGQQILKDLMSGKVIYRTVMGILSMGPDRALDLRASQPEGEALEIAIALSLTLLEVALSLDTLVPDSWRPAHQPLDVMMRYSNKDMVGVVEYVRYHADPALQQTAIRITTVLSGRCPQLVAILEEAQVAGRVIEDYAACLEARIHLPPPPGPPSEDSGVLILQLLLSGLRPSSASSPSLTHLLLSFHMEAVEKSALQPKRDFTCLRVILDLLADLHAPESNLQLHRLSLELLYQLATHPLSADPTCDLLRTTKYGFFARHLEGLAQRQLSSPQWRVSTLRQLAWLLQLASLALYAADPGVEHERVACQATVTTLFHQPQPLVLRLLDLVADSPAVDPEAGECADGEESAAGLHLITAWAQVVEIAVCKRHGLVAAAAKGGSREQIVHEILRCALLRLTSPTCLLSMGLPLSSVVMTLMAVLGEQRGEEEEDGHPHRLPSPLCHSLLSTLLPALLRHSRSEVVRRRLYAALHHLFTITKKNRDGDRDRDRNSHREEGTGGWAEEREGEEEEEAGRLQASLLAVLRSEGSGLVDVVVRDAAHGSPLATALAYGLLGSLLQQDPTHFLSQLQSRGLLQNCLASLGCVSYHSLLLPGEEALRTIYILQAHLTLLQHTAGLRGGKGASILHAMAAVPKLSACPAMDLPAEANRQLVGPLLRLLLTLATQEGELVRSQAVDVVKRHEAFFSAILLDVVQSQEERVLEEAELVTALMARIWPGEAEGGRSGLQELLYNAATFFFHNKAKRAVTPQVALIRGHLLSYLRSLAVRQGVVFQAKQGQAGSRAEPSLEAIASLLHQATGEVVGAMEERGAMARKREEVGEVSRHAVEEILALYAPSIPPQPLHTLRSRRHLAVRELRRASAALEVHVATLLATCEACLETLAVHFHQAEERSRDEMEEVAKKMVEPMETLQTLTQVMKGGGGEGAGVWVGMGRVVWVNGGVGVEGSAGEGGEESGSLDASPSVDVLADLVGSLHSIAVGWCGGIVCGLIKYSEKEPMMLSDADKMKAVPS